LAAIVVAVVLGLQLPGGFPSSLLVDAAKPFNVFNDWVIDNQDTNWLWVHVLVPLKNGVKAAFDGLVTALLRLTWIGVLTLIAAVAGLLAGWRLAITAAAGFALMGVLDLWEESLQTLSLVILAVAVALVIGIPVGILAARRPAVERTLRPILDAMQTVPAFSYLPPLLLLFGIGTTTAMIATVIFALPPAIRLTTLGIRGVSDTVIEVGRAYGSTSRQVLRKIQLPLAKPSIMLGVNQTIMMALGMVVIASSVGFEGLGRVVLNGLERGPLGAGIALGGGLAIVAMAIVLDRVTYGWSRRERTHAGAVRAFGRSLPRRIVALAAVGAVAVGVVVGRQVLRQQLFPEDWTISIAEPVNDAVAWITRTFGDLTSAIGDALITYALDPLRDVLVGLPWWMVCGGAALIAWQISRRIGLTLLSFTAIAAIGLFGAWDPAMDTLSQVFVAVFWAVVLAIPIGIWSARSDRVQRLLRPILDTMQTMPQFVYLVPVVALFNVGRVPGVIAALVYALPPGIRLTDLGIRQVPRETVEAAEAYGATPMQILQKVQLPLARPSILLGVSQTVIMVLSVVIIAGLVGGGGLGLEVIRGLNHDPGQGMVAGVCILLLAVVIDRITQAVGQERRPGDAAPRRRLSPAARRPAKAPDLA
jgi:glycine betaine/proline transport system permease protein